MTDRGLLYSAAFLRSTATGLIGVLVGVHLAKLGFEAGAIGAVVAAGLAGAALAALLVTFLGDRWGRRRFLIGLSLLTAAGGILFAFLSHPLPAAAAAFVGMVNGMGRDRGGCLILDQAILPATVADARRTSTFAWYNVLQDGGGALGGLLAGVPAALRWLTGTGELASLRAAVILYAVLYLLAALISLRLSPAVEAGGGREPAPGRPGDEEKAIPSPGGRVARLTPSSRRILWKIVPLFAFDSLAGGLLTTAILSFFFYEKFGVGVAILGPLFFAARIANAASHPAAAWLAGRFGLVNTMVFTHIPAHLLLVGVAFAPSFPLAALLFILREGLVEMDVPTRQSYVMAVVRPEERTLAAGITNIARVGAWAVGPYVSGLIMVSVSLATPLVIGSAMKVVYDLLLFAAFRRVRPPEERTEAGTAGGAPEGS